MMEDDGTYVRVVTLDDERSLGIAVTHEGIILDAFRADDHLGTKAMTFDEWWEEISEQ